MIRAGIIGTSEFGKSFLAKRLCQSLVASGAKTMAFDPLGYKWAVSYQARSIDALMKACKMKCNWGANVFIDEYDDSDCFGKDDRAKNYVYFAKRSRHHYHNVFILSQRFFDIYKPIRDQFTDLYLFNVDRFDAQEASRRFSCPELANAHTLQVGEYYHAKKGKGASLCKLQS